MPRQAIDKVIPISFEKRLSGASKPFILVGKRTPESERENFVIKILDNVISKESVCRELIANRLAKHCGLNIPECVFIDINEDFVNKLQKEEHPHYEICKNSVGLNFGTKYIDNWTIWSSAFTSCININELQKIFFFDLFISNPDRSRENPNLFFKQNKIYVIDHEKAFSYLQDIIINSKPWLLSEGDKYSIKKHIFFEDLKNRQLFCNDFIRKFNDINDEFWDEFGNLIPQYWVNNSEVLTQLEKIKSNCQLILSNINDFKHQINEMLCDLYFIKY